MPALPTDVALYIKRVRDTLRTGPGFTAASTLVGSVADAQVLIVAKEPGTAGNSITVEVTLPTVTANLDVTLSGTALTIALAQTSGTPDTAENTATLIAAAVNAAAPNLVVAYLPPGSGAGDIDAAIAEVSLAGGTGNENGVATNPMNFLRAQDMASVLELLTNAMDQTGTLTATATGTATTVVDGAGTFVPGQQEGNYVKFKANTTTVALRGLSYKILSNTDRVLRTETMAAATASGDTYEITGGVGNAAVSALREAKSLGDSPSGSIYGDFRIVKDALTRITQMLGIVPATGRLTFTGNAGNTNTVTVGGKVYTFQTVLTNVNGNVLIGGTASDSLDNLIAAINLGAGGGTTYAAATTINAAVHAAAGTGDTMTATAKTLIGAEGNAIATPVTTVAGGTWVSSTLTSGVSGVALRMSTKATMATIAGSTTTNVVMNTTVHGKMRVDQFKGMMATISGEVRKVVGNNETDLFLNKALSSAPGVVTITFTNDTTVDADANRVHPGGQPGENARLADHIAQAEAAIVAYTLPT